MKRLITLLFFCLPFCFPMLAGEPCDILIKEAIALFEKGQYFSAKNKFDKIKNECKYYNRTCDEYIKRCEDSIRARKQHQRMLEARYREERGEKENKERIERRNRNRLVYLSVNNDVPGSFRGIEKDLKNSLEWAKESLDAFWFVRLVTTINEPELGCYRVEAYVEVENAIDSVPKTVSYFTFAEDCGSKEKAANLIYESKSHHLFKNIEENIKKIINANDTIDTVLPSDSKVENVVIYVVPQSCPISEPLEHCLSSNLNSKYLILNRDKEKNDFLEKEFDYQDEGYVKWNQRISKNNRLGVDKVCVVKISERNDGLWFYCSMIELGTTVRVDVPPITNDIVKVKSCSGIDRIQIVADVLAQRFGLLDETAIANLEQKIMKAKELDSTEESRIRRKNIASAFVPGLAQLNREQKGQKIKGGLIIASEALTIGSIALSQSMRNINIKKMNSTNNASLKKMYADKANTYTTVRNISIGAAAAVYVWNVLDAFLYKDKNKDGCFLLNPIISDEYVAVSLSINF